MTRNDEIDQAEDRTMPRGASVRPDDGFPPSGSKRNDGANGELTDTKLGERVRKLRKASGWTLEVLSARSGVSRSALSKIERDAASPTYEVIQRLARGFGIDVTELLVSRPQPLAAARRTISRRNDGPIREARGYVYRLICSELATKKMLPYRATILARSLQDAGGYVHHSGEECLFVLSGEVEFYTEHYAPVLLSPGDAVYIDSGMGHACVSVSTESAEVFWVTVDS